MAEPGANRDLAERFEAKTGLSGANEPGDFAVFVARQAAVVIDIAERQLIGGRYKVPRYVHQSIRNNRAFRAGLIDIANEREQPTKAVRAEASEYLREMISIPTRFGSMCGPSCVGSAWGWATKKRCTTTRLTSNGLDTLSVTTPQPCSGPTKLTSTDSWYRKSCSTMTSRCRISSEAPI